MHFINARFTFRFKYMYTLLIHFIMHLRSFARVDAHVFAGLDVFVCFVFVIAVFFSLSLHFVFFLSQFFFRARFRSCYLD